AALGLIVAVGAVAPPLSAQQPTRAPRTADGPPVAKLVAEPGRLVMKVGDSLAFKVTAYDAQGNVIPDAAVRVGGPRMAVFFGDGIVKAFRAGTYTAVATAMG